MKGVFVGLTTLDSIYLVDQLPGADEKVVARDFVMNAGGPATNAAVTFAYLGGRACLVSPIGTSPAAALVHDDLARCAVRHIELVPEPGANASGTEPAAGTYGALAVPGAPGGAGPHPGRPGVQHPPSVGRAGGPRSGRGLPRPERLLATPGAGPLGPAGHGGTVGYGATGGPSGAGHNGAGHSGYGGYPGAGGPGGAGGHSGVNGHGGHGLGGHGAAGLPSGSGTAGPKLAAAHPGGPSAMSYALPMSAVMVTSVSGERAVTSTHGMVPRCTANTSAAAAVADADVVLVDGHQVDAAVGLLRTLRGGGPPVLLDGGSWKPGTEQILPFVDVVICSTAFRPPGFDPAADILDLLLRYGPFFVAVTDGPGPIRWATTDRRGYVLPPVVTARDTLGAGDVFHGAFAWLMAHGALATDELVGSLGEASRVAARSVQTFGPRSWMT